MPSPRTYILGQDLYREDLTLHIQEEDNYFELIPQNFSSRRELPYGTALPQALAALPKTRPIEFTLYMDRGFQPDDTTLESALDLFEQCLAFGLKRVYLGSGDLYEFRKLIANAQPALGARYYKAASHFAKACLREDSPDNEKVTEWITKAAQIKVETAEQQATKTR